MGRAEAPPFQLDLSDIDREKWIVIWFEPGAVIRLHRRGWVTIDEPLYAEKEEAKVEGMQGYVSLNSIKVFHHVSGRWFTAPRLSTFGADRGPMMHQKTFRLK